MNRQSNELYHFGIKGQKWGIRRYQNKDGSLTPAGRKRVSKEYAKYAKAAQTEVATTSNYVKAYNRAADKMNNGLIDKYNSDYDKKLGKKRKIMIMPTMMNIMREWKNFLMKLWKKVLLKFCMRDICPIRII